MKLPLFEDPKENNQQSVSITLLAIAVVLFIATGLLQVFDVIQTTGVFPELLYSAIALYLGRKTITVGGKIFGNEKAQEIQTKLEEKNV